MMKYSESHSSRCGFYLSQLFWLIGVALVDTREEMLSLFTLFPLMNMFRGNVRTCVCVQSAVILSLNLSLFFFTMFIWQF